MAAKKARKKDAFVHMWAESMVPELTRAQAMLLHHMQQEQEGSAAHTAGNSLERKIDEHALHAMGLIEKEDELSSFFYVSEAGTYVLARMKEMGWL